MVFKLFGKGKEPEPEKEPVSINGFRLFPKGQQWDAAEFAISLAGKWTLVGVWAEGTDGTADPGALREMMDMAGEMDYPYECYLVNEQDGSLGVILDWDWDEDPEDMELDESEIQWIAKA